MGNMPFGSMEMKLTGIYQHWHLKKQIKCIQKCEVTYLLLTLDHWREKVQTKRAKFDKE